MNEVINNCIRQCNSRSSRLALPEGEDPRIQAAALQIKAQNIATPVLLGDAATIASVAKTESHYLSAIDIVDTSEPAPNHLHQVLVGKKRKITSDNVADYMQHQSIELSRCFTTMK